MLLKNGKLVLYANSTHTIFKSGVTQKNIFSIDLTVTATVDILYGIQDLLYLVH